MKALEQDALEVLSLVRSIKNSFAPANRIPPEILSDIPDYYDEDDVDQDLITLTHVCRSWRDTFTSRSSLWTRLDFTNLDKTHTYIHRSKSSPLEIYLKKHQNNCYLDDAFFPVIPYIHRIKSLIIRARVLPDIIRHFSCHVPLLERLDVNLTCVNAPTFDSALFKGDLSSLHELSLSGYITLIPWNNLANLTTLKLDSYCPGIYSVTLLLNFFERAPLLHTIVLEDAIPMSSNAPADRIVSIPHLNALSIASWPPRSILLNHLCIPTGASLILVHGETSPLQEYLPETSTNLNNLSHITAMNLHFDVTEKYVRLSGPSGGLRVSARLVDEAIPTQTKDRRILLSLSPPILSTTQRLAVSKYDHPTSPEIEECPVFQTLSAMTNLHTLVLTECDNLPFILALNPDKNSSKLVLCPGLEELVLYVESQDQFQIRCLLRMTKERASRGIKLSSITIAGLGELVPAEGVFKLGEYVTRVAYRVDDVLPDWDYLPSGETE